MGWLEDDSEYDNAELFAHEFMLESNYGALEKDSRLKSITTLLKHSMISCINKHKTVPSEYVDVIIINVKTKYKESTTKPITIIWKLVNTVVYDSTSKIYFENGKTNYIGDDTYVITIYCTIINRKQHNTHLLQFIKSDVDIVVSHELKHILDSVDGLFKFDKKYKPPVMGKQQYLMQDQEFHNFVITVIMEIQKFKKEDPTLTFEQALDKSKYYSKIKIHLDNHKLLNKFRSKIADFWIKHFIPTNK